MSLGSEQTDELLATILDLLRDFSTNKKKAGDEFRKEHARNTIEYTFDLLERNSTRLASGRVQMSRIISSMGGSLLNFFSYREHCGGGSDPCSWF